MATNNEGKVSIATRLKQMGPAAIITSAFIGPGTVVTATTSGATFGFSLLWVVVLAVIALMLLMEMASRIGIAGKMNAIEAAISVFPNSKGWKWFVTIIIALGTLAVCFAFEAGNIVGASLGLSDATGLPQWVSVAAISIIALVTVFITSYKLLSTIMQVFVGIMGAIFVIAMVAVQPSITGIASGLVPVMPEGGVVSALALVGTTLIGVNLVLHSITSEEKWGKSDNPKESLANARFDILANIFIGGLITFAIVVVGATVLFGSDVKIGNALAFTQSLEPVLGDWARIVGDMGIFAAGLSSAITVPFTMRTILSRAFHLEGGMKAAPIQVLAVIAVFFGAAFALFGASPAQIIIFAQATSGFVLPFIALFLIVAANNKKLLGEYANKPWQNIAGTLAVVLAFILGFNGLYNVIIQIL